MIFKIKIKYKVYESNIIDFLFMEINHRNTIITELAHMTSIFFKVIN